MRVASALHGAISCAIKDHSRKLASDLKNLAKQDNVDLQIKILEPRATGQTSGVRLILQARDLNSLEFGNWQHPAGGSVSRWLAQLKSSRSSRQQGI